MKLLSVNMTLDPETGGGSAVRTRQATAVLARLGVSCAIVTAGEMPDASRHAELQGITLITMRTMGGRFRLPVTGFGAVRRAVRDADIVMLVNHWTLINVVAWRAARRLGKPYVVCPAGALPIDGGRSRLLKRIYNALWGRSIVAKADAHIAVTHDETRQFGAYGVDPATVVVIPNGMPDLPEGDAARFRQRHRLPDVPLLLFLGRLAPIKGPDLLVGAFARCAAARPDWHLVLAGPDDGMLADLVKQVGQAGLGARVHFAGFVNEAEKADALAAAELVIVPSRREAMSIVVLEAASAGRPVLVSDQCGIPEVAVSGGGWLVAADEHALAEGLLVATADRDALARRGRVWQTEAAARYSWDAIGGRYRDLLVDVCRRRGHEGPAREREDRH